MAKKARKRAAEDKTLWSIGPEYAVYQPGSESKNFFLNQPMLERAGNQRMKPGLALCLLLNDVLARTDGLKLDGRFFCTRPSTHIRLYAPLDRFDAGPSILFTPYTQSREEKSLWLNSDMQYKITLASAFWKYLDSSHPAMPIWMGTRRTDHNEQSREVQTIFRNGLTPEEEEEDMIGLVVDMFDQKFLCVPVQDFIKFATNPYPPGARFITYRYRTGSGGMKLSSQGSAINRRLLKDDDQVLALINAIFDLVESNPEQMITYGRGRSWASGATTQAVSTKSWQLKMASEVPVVRVRGRIVNRGRGRGGTQRGGRGRGGTGRGASVNKSKDGTEKAGSGGSKKGRGGSDGGKADRSKGRGSGAVGGNLGRKSNEAEETDSEASMKVRGGSVVRRGVRTGSRVVRGQGRASSARDGNGGSESSEEAPEVSEEEGTDWTTDSEDDTEQDYEELDKSDSEIE